MCLVYQIPGFLMAKAIVCTHLSVLPDAITCAYIQSKNYWIKSKLVEMMKD